MGEPVSEPKNRMLTKWFTAADKYLPTLEKAIANADLDTVSTAVEELQSAARSPLLYEALRSASDIVGWVHYLEKLSGLVRGQTVGDVASVLGAIADDTFRDIVDVYSKATMDEHLNKRIAAIVDTVESKMGTEAEQMSPAEFAAEIHVDDADAPDRAIRFATSRKALQRAVDAIHFDTLARDIGGALYESALKDALKRATKNAEREVTSEWRDALRGIWDGMGHRGRVDVFLRIDAKYVPRHPRVEFVTRDDMVVPGTDVYAGAWNAEMLNYAQGMFIDGDFVDDAYMRTFFAAHHATRSPLMPEQSLAIAGDQSVFLATDDAGSKWVMKYAEDVAEEEANWIKLRDEGGKTPDILEGYSMFGLHLLVVERLFPLDHTDDEYEIAKQLLTNQFPYLHTFAVHADIKPDNIMKRVYGSDSNRGPDYFIIDMDVDDGREPGGFTRTHYTPMYNSARPGANFPMTWRDDILEFFYTLNALALHRQSTSDPKVGPYGENKLSPIYAALDYYDTLPARSAERRLIESDHFTDPISAMPQWNSIMWAIAEEQLKGIQRSGVSLGLRNAFDILKRSPHAHPADPISFEPYRELADAFDLESRERDVLDPRRNFLPVEITKTAGPFAGASTCWTCARTPKKLANADMFREKAEVQRIFCGQRCQEVFHATDGKGERM